MSEIITCKEAKAAGFKRYFTGNTCKYGHVAERRVSNQECVECKSIRDHAYHIADPEKKRIRGRIRYAENLEIEHARKRGYHSRNPEKSCARRAARRARELLATPAWACRRTIADFYIEAKYQSMQVDHIVPLKHPLVCGLHVEDNLQLLTSIENRKKHNLFDNRSA